MRCEAKEPNWVFAGTSALLHRMSACRTGGPTGSFHELSFRWRDRVALRGRIRTTSSVRCCCSHQPSTDPNSDAR